MSAAISVFHGAFGRVCLYAMDRTMVPHAHREGHLLFHISGAAGEVVVDGRPYPLAPGRAVAVSPWQGHYYRAVCRHETTLALVLYVRPQWFVESSDRALSSLEFGRVSLDMTRKLALLAAESAHDLSATDINGPAMEKRLCALTQRSFDQSWQWAENRAGVIAPKIPARDFRVRNALRVLMDKMCEPLAIDQVARAVGLSRPHFYKLFRQQVGVTPNIYVNSLRMERAIDRLAGSSDAVADIGLDLGFSSQASFSRFFIANGVVPPSTYRRSVSLSAAH